MRNDGEDSLDRFSEVVNVFGQFLEARTDAQAKGTRSDVWSDLNAPLAPPARLLAFDMWVRGQLSTRLRWPNNFATKTRQIEQCRILVETLVLDLWRRGWMLDGKRLAGHITQALEDVAKAQSKGGVRDLYAYLKRSLNAYVGANAEEIQEEVRRHATGHAGTYAADVLAAHGISRSQASSIPELVAQRREEIDQAKAETLREKLSRARRQNAACSGPAVEQQELL